MKERPVQTRMYVDTKYHCLSIEARFLFVYSFTNAYIGMSGWYELPDATICLETGLTAGKLEMAKKELESKGMVYFKDGWIAVLNAQKYLSYARSPLNTKIASDELQNVPIWFKQYVEGYYQGTTPVVPGYTKDQRPKTKDNRPKTITNDDFEKFWNVYPEKKGKQEALKAFQRATNLPSIAELLAIIERQKQYSSWRRGYIPHPATWLNQGRWDDEEQTREAIDLDFSKPREAQ